MLVLNDDLSIYLTRGDAVSFSVSMYEDESEDSAIVPFAAGDIVRFKVTERKNCSAVVLQKDFVVMAEDAEAINIVLTSKETKLGGVISKPVDYWYEVELNPDTDPKTIIGYDDETGAKILRLLPEGADLSSGDTDDSSGEPDFEEPGSVDGELSLTSERPVQNKVISRAVAVLDKRVSDAKKHVDDSIADFRKENGNADASKNHNHDEKYAPKVHGHAAGDIPGLANAMAAMTTAARIAYGEYTGNGKYGEDNPNTLTFDFEPKILILICSDQYFGDRTMGTWFKGMKLMRCEEYSGDKERWTINVTDLGKTIKWYSGYYKEGVDESVFPWYQFNSDNSYTYIAIG